MMHGFEKQSHTSFNVLSCREDDLAWAMHLIGLCECMKVIMFLDPRCVMMQNWCLQ